MMNTEEEIVKVQSDSSLRSDFIQKYTNFILSSARKTTGRYIDKEDDEFSISLTAFDEAIMRYNPDKGDFFVFAARVIHSRIIDDMRRNHTKTIPFSSLETEDKDGGAVPFDAMGDSDAVTDTRLELEALKEELGKLNITFFELAKCSPKTKKTKREAFKAISFLTKNSSALEYMKAEGVLPAGLIEKEAAVSKKILERHRKYIIAAVIILTGDYPSVAGYVKNIEEM